MQTGRLRVFPRDKITADVVMASACLPFLFRAVEIDGVPYWDGGYMGNPALFPFFRATDTEDVLIVQINPIERSTTPTSSREIMNRVNEITFNSSLLAELRAIEFVGRLIDQGRLPRGTGPGQYRRINVHRIALDGDARRSPPTASSTTTTISSRCCTRPAAARRAASSTRISTTSAGAAPSTCEPRSPPSGRERRSRAVLAYVSLRAAEPGAIALCLDRAGVCASR